jgi:hypothetical protein
MDENNIKRNGELERHVFMGKCVQSLFTDILLIRFRRFLLKFVAQF